MLETISQLAATAAAEQNDVAAASASVSLSFGVPERKRETTFFDRNSLNFMVRKSCTYS